MRHTSAGGLMVHKTNLDINAGDPTSVIGELTHKFGRRGQGLYRCQHVD